MSQDSEELKRIENENSSEISTTVEYDGRKGIEIKKQIAKFKKSYNQSYKQRPIMIVPIYDNRFIFNHKFIIFGYVEVETLYKDYKDPFDKELVSVQNQLMKVSSFEKRKDSQQLVLNIQTQGTSGLKDFQFLVEHFSKHPDQNYREFYKSLENYQQQCIKYQQHFEEISQLVKSRIINEDEILQAIFDYEAYLDKYIKNNYSESDFLFSGLSAINMESLDIEPRRFKLTYAMMSLLGIEPNSENQEFLHSIVNFTNLLGVERMQETLTQMKLFNTDVNKASFEHTLITADCIAFRVTLEYELVVWPDLPNYLIKHDLLGVVVRADIPLSKIKQVIDIRSTQNVELVNNFYFPDMQCQFDYIVQTEMFLEKFYPQLYKNPESHRTLSLRKFNKVINIL